MYEGEPQYAKVTWKTILLALGVTLLTVFLVFGFLSCVAQSSPNRTSTKAAEPVVTGPPTVPTPAQRWTMVEENAFLANCNTTSGGEIRSCRCLLNYLEANLSLAAMTADMNAYARDGDESTVMARGIRYCKG